MATVTPDPESPAPSSNALRKIKVPLELLAVDGINPEQGDDVTFTVSGKLAAISGKDGEVEVVSVNDTDLAAPEPELSEDEAALDAARRADEGMAY